MATLKTFMGTWLTPGMVIFLLLGAAWVVLATSGGKRRRAVMLVSLAWLTYGLGTTIWLPERLTVWLAGPAKPVLEPQRYGEIGYIVVLGGGVRDQSIGPAASQLQPVSLQRAIEGIRLFYALGQRPTLIMTGSGPGGDPQRSEGARMAALARELGVPAAKVVAEVNARDTHGNAQGVKTLVQEAPFFLVTSAVHLARARRIFELQGMRPIPAPADVIGGRAERNWREILPKGEHLQMLESAWHEVLGQAYVWLWPGRGGR